ncbi:hypothetical protein HN51_054951, partial [Arachis hypogaea]
PPLAALGSLSPSPLSCVPSLASGSHSVSAATRHCPGQRGRKLVLLFKSSFQFIYFLK